MIQIIDKKKCCGCASCVQRCPKQCIILSEDSEGFLYPVVDVDKCVDCGLCEKVCPVIHVEPPISPLFVYGAKNLNDDERMLSSSGGVFLPLAREIIHEGGVVFGAVYDDNWEVVLSHAETLDGVYAMMGSKYLQARTESAYHDAELFLKQDRNVLFTGTPCQIAGLRRFLGKDYPHLLTVDFACHGVPSPGVWRRYLGELKQQISASMVAAEKNTVMTSSLNTIPAITGIIFRDKTLYGWKKYSFVIQGKSVFKVDQNAIFVSDNNDVYMKGFLSNLYLRPSCHECHCKNGVNHSDITIGDLWGVDRMMPDFDDDKGVSLIFIFTAKGRNYFDRLSMEVRGFDYQSVVDANGGFNEQPHSHPRRSDFFVAYNLNQPVAETVKRLLHVPIYRKFFIKVKRVIRKTLNDFKNTCD